ncbi:MAG: DUF4012 domain-containing protein, partial [Actinomycetota bacterium]|nr:DUF4012 domain-containing protein [Actinomycetota bacterium]
MTATLQRASSAPARRAIAHRRRTKRRGGRVALWAVLGLFVLVIAAAAWIGVRGILAKDHLERAQALVGQLQEQVTADPQGALQIVAFIQVETAEARSLTGDPIWRAGELVPVVGKNLGVVRELAESVDDVSKGALEPLAAVASTLDVSALKPTDGRINLEPIIAATESVATADEVIVATQQRVEGIDADGTLRFVADAQIQLADQLGKAAELTGTARTVTQLVPPMLGAYGPRNYIVMFQNNAEARPLGGNPAALILLNLDNGAISIAQQASSSDFDRKQGSPVELDPNVFSVYYKDFANYVMDITTRPDFPTAARLAQGYW